MASQSDPAVEEIIELLASLFLDELCTMSVCAFILYDWTVTLAREVRLFWIGKARPLSAILYFSNKYLNILSHIIYVVEDSSAPLSDQLHQARQCAEDNIFLILHSTRRICWATGICTNSASLAVRPRLPFLNRSVRHKYVAILNRVSAILADAIVAVITWKLLPDSNIIRGTTTKISGLASTMVWNGMIYFIVLSILNILQLIFTELSIATNGEYNDVSIFTAPLSSVLVSHFLLDLQEAHQRKAVGLASSDSLHISQSIGGTGTGLSINFANALGSLGATIDPAHYFGRELEDDDECVDDPSADGISLNEGEPSQESRIDIDGEFGIMEVLRGLGEAAA